METGERGETQSFWQKLLFLRDKIARATEAKPFDIQLQNPKLVNFDFLGSEVPERGKVVDLIKRDKRRKSPDSIIVQLGPLGENEVVSYACFPISSVEIQENQAIIDCTKVLKEGVFTALPNFFVEKSEN